MRGYVAQRRNRFYAAIYEGTDPITGRERCRWHPAGTDRAQAGALAARLAAGHGGDARRVGPTLGVYLTRDWLPTKQLALRPSTWDSYRRNIELHILPTSVASRSVTSAPNISNASTRACSRPVASTTAVVSTQRPSSRSIESCGARSLTRPGAGSSPATPPSLRTHPNVVRSRPPSYAPGMPTNSMLS